MCVSWIERGGAAARPSRRADFGGGGPALVVVGSSRGGREDAYLPSCWYKLTALYLNRFKLDYLQAHRYHTNVIFYLEVLNIISTGNTCDNDKVYRLNPTIRLDHIKKKEITNVL